MIAVRRTKVGIHYCSQGRFADTGYSIQGPRPFLQRALDRFDYQFIARRKVPIKAAVS